MSVRVQAGDFDPAEVLAGFGTGAGAVVTFTGQVRDLDGGGLLRMEIEHYPAMTEPAIAAMVAEARRRWSLSDVLVIHRFGALVPGERIMMVATAARHRAGAFAAAEFLMDYLKSRAPFWKKEITEAGATWVEGKDADEVALGRWG
ncbi:MAG: molybdenum cofactor biosynthesis protein MoaE [Rhodobacteraceae bacterium]|nr:molybdenum cofactor biosynthesis protein MoaE [Paracoccaceae bacterium]